MADQQGAWGGEFDPLSDEEEKRVLFSVFDSFAQYRRAAHYNVTHVRRQSFYALPSSQWTLLAQPPFSILDTFSAVDEAIDANADVADAILSCGRAAFGIDTATSYTDPNSLPPYRGFATRGDMEKARITIRMLFRDWSDLGAEERLACYGPIVEAIKGCFSDVAVASRHRVRALVPGAGLGRLVYELVAQGYSVEGNEFSYHQLLTSSFVLNHTTSRHQYALYPFALSFSNLRSRRHQLHRVMIPDVHPGSSLLALSETYEVPANERMSMTAGDFRVLYQAEEYSNSFDAVCTVFFIDTARNLLTYIETVKKCLKPGGVWINLGPLLWHVETHDELKDESRNAIAQQDTESQSRGLERSKGSDEAGCVELTDEEVIKLLEHYGFTIEQHEPNMESTGYIQDPESMYQHIYRPSFWIARKSADQV